MHASNTSSTLHVGFAVIVTVYLLVNLAYILYAGEPVHFIWRRQFAGAMTIPEG